MVAAPEYAACSPYTKTSSIRPSPPGKLNPLFSSSLLFGPLFLLIFWTFLLLSQKSNLGLDVQDRQSLVSCLIPLSHPTPGLLIFFPWFGGWNTFLRFLVVPGSELHTIFENTLWSLPVAFLIYIHLFRLRRPTIWCWGSNERNTGAGAPEFWPQNSTPNCAVND